MCSGSSLCDATKQSDKESGDVGNMFTQLKSRMTRGASASRPWWRGRFVRCIRRSTPKGWQSGEEGQPEGVGLC